MNSTKEVINNSFADSPTYKVVIIDGSDVESRLISGDSSTEKELLFRPEFMTYKGALVDIDGVHWMVKEIDHDGVKPKAQITKCNQVLKWNNADVTYEVPCIVEDGTKFGLQHDEYLVTAKGELRVLVTYNSITKEIKEQFRFIIRERAYQVVGINDLTHIDNDKGYLQLVIALDTKTSGDDLTNNVADNSQVNVSENSDNWSRW
jgi:hypothetical protein